MRSIVVIISLATFYASSCGQITKKQNQATINPSIQIEEQEIESIPLSQFNCVQPETKMLEKAYQEESAIKLKDFFDTWSKDVPPITDTDLTEFNDTIQQAYKAFISFYNPHRYDIYEKVDFLIVQNYVKICFTDNKIYYTEQEWENFVVDKINQYRWWSMSRKNRAYWLKRGEDGKLSDHTLDNFSPHNDFQNWLVDSIVNFRPNINRNGKTPIFLTKKYAEILKAFLGNEYIELGTGGIMNPARSKGESEKRKVFLENYVKIFHGHWGGYWQLLSYPEAESITFDKNMEYARVDFRFVYQGGYAILKNQGGKWTLMSSKLTWIE